MGASTKWFPKSLLLDWLWPIDVMDHYYRFLRSKSRLQYSTWVGTSFRDDKQKVGVSDKIRFFSSIYHYLSPLFTFIFVVWAKNLFSVSFFLPGLDFLFIASSSIVFTPPFLVPLREDWIARWFRIEYSYYSSQMSVSRSSLSAHQPMKL